MNKIFIIGRLGKDPETRFTASGQKVTTFTVATNRRRGEKDETIWYRVTSWGRFEKMITFLKKGSGVVVSGELSVNKWKDPSGKEMTSLEINADSLDFLPSSRAENNGNDDAGFGNRARTQTQKGNYAPMGDSDESTQTAMGRGSEALSEMNEDPIPF